MKKVFVTLRVDIVHAYDERRDALDQRWINFLLELNVLPVLVPNNLKYVERALDYNKIDAVILTGGNSLFKYDGCAPDRDNVERYILEWALDNDIPVLGVCRGMQVIQDFFGVELKAVTGHVAVRQHIDVTCGGESKEVFEVFETVNAFHDFASSDSVEELEICARSKDDLVMAVKHVNYDVFGIMWHPEREAPFSKCDLDLVRYVLDKPRKQEKK